MHDEGPGVSPYVQSTFKWWREEQIVGNTEAQNEYGRMLTVDKSR